MDGNNINARTTTATRTIGSFPRRTHLSF